MSYTQAGHTRMDHPHPIVDDLLIQRIASGDRDALHTLYEGVSPAVYGFALSITRNSHDAEDVLQETILALWQRAGEYRPQGKPMAWIFTIARNFSLMKLRDSGRTAPLEDYSFTLPEAVSELEIAEQRLTLSALLLILSSQEQQIVLLHAVQGMKNREIAEILQIPLNTVLSKYRRAIRKMRKHLEGHLS